MDSSSAVRVTEVKGPLHAHSGTGPSADKRQTANFPGIRESLKPRLVMSLNFIGWPSSYDLAATASNKFKKASFFSAGRNEASNEFLANSRKCSSVKPNES